MKTPFAWFGGSSPTPPPARTALRELYRAAGRLQFSDPYAPARLVRIADQTEYFLLEWPPDQWPSYLHSGQPLPSRDELLHHTAQVKNLAAARGSSTQPGWSHQRWERALRALLGTLQPFA